MNTRAIKQWIARTLLFLPSESAGQMMKRYRKELADINELKGTDYGLFLMDWSKMLWDENNMENNMPYFIEKTGYGTDAKAICLYKKGSDEYVILNKCLYDTKKDANGYRKEYWGNKIDDCIIWIVCFQKNTIFRALALSILPSVLFLFSGIMSRSVLLILSAVIFAPCHILISYKNAK